MLTDFVIGDRGLGASGDTHPAWMMAHAVAGEYLVVGASAVGQIHLVRGSPRDDAFIVRSAGPWLAVAVADGVGSRPLSRYGATYTAESLTAMLLRPFAPFPPDVGNSESPSVFTKFGALAPPPMTEETTISVGAASISPGHAALIAGLTDWTQKLTREEIHPTEGFIQAASVGWWSIPDQPASPVVTEGDPAQITAPAPDPPSDNEMSELSPDAPTSPKPNLLEIMKTAFEKSHLGLREHARSLELELVDLGCTALALLVNVETREGVAGQVGDGAILGLTAQGEVRELVKSPDTDDPQATYTLAKHNFERYLGIDVLSHAPDDPFVAYYVMTDGISGDLLYSPKPDVLMNWAQKVDQNLRFSSSPAQAASGMLNWLATYQVKGSWDDRTLVVITQRERNHGDDNSITEQPESAEPTDHQ